MSGLAISQLEHLKDFAKQLKRHTKGRRAIHIHMSRLLKHHQESTFRRQAAVFIKPIVDKFSGSRNFSLSNNDLVLITNDVSLDDIEPVLVKIRKHFKKDPLIISLDPIQGQSDDFTVCYDLKKDFDEFFANIERMLKAEKAGNRMTEPVVIQAQPVKQAANRNLADEVYSSLVNTKPTISTVKIERTDANIEVQKIPLDVMTISKLEKFILNMDLSAYVRSQNIIAIAGTGKPTVAMVERAVKPEEVVSQLIKEVDIQSNLWLRGYLDDIIANGLILSKPELKNKKSIASVVPLTTSTIIGPHFAAFEQSHRKLDKSAIVIEISLMDVLSDSVKFEAAQSKARLAGYKLAIGQIDPFAFTMLDPSLLKADFFKVSWRPIISDWLGDGNHERFTQALYRIGLPRVIASGCDDDEAITTMRALGVILFTGSAVDSYKP